jgi:PHD/YefM family antitoxin component YafN of YafNO toxin-antitoxin module
MSPKTKNKKPEIIIRNGKPASVIIDIEDYREMLERLEDTEDLKLLEKMRSGELKFRRLEDFLQEHGQGA